jgi:hypothetical protein
MGASETEGEEERSGKEDEGEVLSDEDGDEGSLTSTDGHGDVVLEGDVAYIPASQCRAVYQVKSNLGPITCVCTRRGACKKTGHLQARRNMQIGATGYYLITKGKNQQGVFVRKEDAMTRTEASEHRALTLEANRKAVQMGLDLRARSAAPGPGGLKTTGLEKADEEIPTTLDEMEASMHAKDKRLEELSVLVRNLQQASIQGSATSRKGPPNSATARRSQGPPTPTPDAPGWATQILGELERLQKDTDKLKHKKTNKTPSSPPDSDSDDSDSKDDKESDPEDSHNSPSSSSSDSDSTDTTYSLPVTKGSKKNSRGKKKKPRWYSITQGRNSRDIGVYSDWAEVKRRTHRVSGSIYTIHVTRAEAELAVLRQLKKNKAKKAKEAAKQDKNKFKKRRTTEDADGQKAADGLGPDDSTGKGTTQLFELSANDAPRFLKTVSPPGLSEEAQTRLGDQLADIGGLPGTSGVGSEDTALSTVAMAFERMASRKSAHQDLGGTTDPSYKSEKRNTLGTIKSMKDLRERIKDLRGPRNEVLGQVKANLVAVIEKAGYSLTESELWATQSPLLRMSRDGYEFYIHLHSHLLEVALGPRGWGAAEGELKIHVKKLKDIREIYQSRIQIMMRHYVYLREGVHNSWSSLRVQEMELERLNTLLVPSADPADSTPAPRAATTSRAYCGHCMTGLHPGGKQYCPWKLESRVRAKELGSIAILALGTTGLPADECVPIP